MANVLWSFTYLTCFPVLREGLRNYVWTKSISKSSTKGMKRSKQVKENKGKKYISDISLLFILNDLCNEVTNTLNKLIKRTHLIGFFVEKMHHSTQCSSSWLHVLEQNQTAPFELCTQITQQRLHFLVFNMWLMI